MPKLINVKLLLSVTKQANDMARNERSIKVAWDKLTDQPVEADELFKTYKTAYEVRLQIQTKERPYYCCECEQPLTVSTGKYVRIYFKHFPGHHPCILTDGNLSPEEMENFARIHIAKESQRHIHLKNEIARKLKTITGVEPDSIAIDNKFIVRGYEKRRPDVYCRYNGKELVFEIQLSNLSLRYTRSRHNFYKKNGSYLVWILDNFDLNAQSQMVKDIKYLTPYQNFFKLDEKADTFKLLCDYKTPYITKENTLQSKWTRASVSLEEIKFDEEIYQMYYFNFPSEQINKEAELETIQEKYRISEKEKLQGEILKSAKAKAKSIIDDIKSLKQKEALDFSYVQQEFSALNSFDLQILNDELGFNKTEKPGLTITRWIRETRKRNQQFLHFILNCEEIEFNVSEKNIDGTTAFLEACNNENVSTMSVTLALFSRGYHLNDAEKQFIAGEIAKKPSSFFITFLFVDRLHDRNLTRLVWDRSQFLIIIESAKQGKIVGYNYKPHEWLNFANNAITNYGRYWDYIEYAFKYYGLWDTIIARDHKGTFQQKLEALYSQMPEQEYDIDPVFKDLYPEMSDSSF